MLNSGNKLYYGVVESRADPLKLGRCKVRIVGIHTENTALLPTKDLPWAFPIQPITSGAMSGIGHSPTGPVEGTWIVCVFRDEGSFQEPLMLGTIAGIPEEKGQSLGDPYGGKSNSKYDGIRDIETQNPDIESDNVDFLQDDYGNPVLDSSGNPIRTGGKQVLTQTESVQTSVGDVSKSNYKIGSVASKYESSGAGAINDYNGKAKGDRGGASYGKYQLASYMDSNGPKSNASDNPPVMDYLSTSKYKDEFRGKVPGTAAFDSTWKSVAAKDPSGFEAEQVEYATGKYYAPTSNKLRATGLDLSKRGPAVQESIYSTSIQYGNGAANKVFHRALDGKDINSMTDAEIVTAIQDDKLKNVRTDFKSSPSLWNGLENRIKSEKADLLALAGKDSQFSAEEIEAIQDASGNYETKINKDGKPERKLKDGKKPTVIPSSGVLAPRTVDQNTRPGFQDPHNLYPRGKWIGESDVSRLARNEKIEQTIMTAKDRTRAMNVGTAGGGKWKEPKSPYKAKYPLNHVYQTESGHVTEFDDTPDAERIHIYHRSGSFIEWHPDGTVVYKSVKDQFEVTVGDRNILVEGTCNITVRGDTNIYSQGVLNMESDGDMNIKTKANLKIGAMGTCHIESNRGMHVGSGDAVHISGSPNVFLNCSYTPSSVKAGDYLVDKISVEVYDDDEAVPIYDPEEEASAIAQARKEGSVTNDPKVAQTAEPYIEDIPVAPKDAPNPEHSCGPDIKPNDHLSTNFTLSDVSTGTVLTKQAVGDQNGMTKCEIINNLIDVCKQVLEPIRMKYGNEFIITSAFRAGSGGSQHLKGQAVDIQFPGLSKEQACHRAQEIAKVLGTFDQMIIEYHGRTGPVFHISYNKQGNRNQKLTTPNLSKYFGGFRDTNMTVVYP